ncbi:MAG: hypothetical protein ATN33_00120 [Epulopiscium sp. Nele67-Bin001]|nr:MAG: hypothetical protein ATN33_00120 [Epulopiscium sp. Nele67-Bin001]
MARKPRRGRAAPQEGSRERGDSFNSSIAGFQNASSQLLPNAASIPQMCRGDLHKKKKKSKILYDDMIFLVMPF